MKGTNETFGIAENSLDKVKSVIFDKNKVDIEKMDELAGYYAMEYSLNYDIKLRSSEDMLYEGKSERINYYEILHKQNTVEEYCYVLKQILWEMSLEDILKGYAELEKNPEADLVEIMRKVFRSNCEDKCINGQCNKGERHDESEIEIKEEDYQSHRYEQGKRYLSVLYNERVNNTDAINDAYIILFDEKEQYKKGKEVLQRGGLRYIIGREDEEAYFKAVRMEKEKGINKVPIAIFKDNTFYSERSKGECMHAWKGEIVLVKVIGKAENGMLITKLCKKE